CIVRIDNETIIRTATIWKSLSPFWGEEYNVHLPSTFHSISFYVMDEDAISRDDMIGKVSITKDVLTASPQGVDSWLCLSEIDPDEEVQGEIHLQIEICGEASTRKLRCHVFEARDLARKDLNGASDPFVKVRYNGKTEESVVKKSCYPRWNEVFEFDLGNTTSENTLYIEVWDWDMVGKNDFLGKVAFNINKLLAIQQKEGWFLLRPDKAQRSKTEGNLGSLRLQLRLRDESVLPSRYYQPLVELLLHSVNDGESGHLLTLIDEAMTAENRQEVATNMVKLFLGRGQANKFLDAVIKLELDRTSEPNTIFRNNSLASKSMECFLKVTGMQYLHSILGPTINRVFEEKKYVELDPNKVEFREAGCSGLHRYQTEAEVIQQSTQWVQSYLVELIEAIVKSVEQCPGIIRITFRKLFKRVEERFPQDQYKVIQRIGNMEAQAGGGKETWMAPLQPHIIQGVSVFKDFIVKLIDIEDNEVLECQNRVSLQTTSTIKEGYLLMHTSKERGILTSSHFKKHHFCLTPEALYHSKMPNAKKGASIPLEKIRAVEKVDEKCFGSPYVMQIISTNDTEEFEIMYLQCKNVNELNQWLSSVRKYCVSNEQMMNSYHPSVFKGEKWSCCHQKEKAAPGCDKTHFGVTLQEWNDPLNPDLESHLIYRQLLAAQAYFLVAGVEEEEKEDDSVNRLFPVIHDLEQAHRLFEKWEKFKDKNFSLELLA
uniref:RAS p21 protein activator 4 n=1 Tax=Callorhinchus milii TaxID=7868 RepID=A0A4W3ILY0_CALMI